MIFETVKTEGLAQLSYLVGDPAAGTCAVVDPRRDVEVYLELARRHGVRIDHVLETHIHADFVSGSRELARHTGAPVRAGRSDAYGFPHEPLDDGDVIRLGDLRLRVLHTPGHSPEHVCYVLSGGAGASEPWGVFTGDVLFAGSVGRPDLAAGLSEEELARALRQSIVEKLLPLGDDVVVFPGHGAGSPCGSEIGDRDVTTLGYERRHNEKLAADGGEPPDEDDFVRAVLGDLPEEPRYYSRMKEINAEGSETAGGLGHLGALSPAEFRARADAEGTVVVDAREIVAFGGGHIEAALNIALRDAFPVWAGWLLDPGDELLLVPPDASDVDTLHRHLHRIGLDRVGGWLRRGMRGWIEAGHSYVRRPDMTVHELRDRLRDGDGELQVLDVRSDAEWRTGHVPGARHVYAPHVPAAADELDRERPVATYCGTGYRASAAASLLERLGFDRVHNVPGSMEAWNAAGYPLEDKRDAKRGTKA